LRSLPSPIPILRAAPLIAMPDSDPTHSNEPGATYNLPALVPRSGPAAGEATESWLTRALRTVFGWKASTIRADLKDVLEDGEMPDGQERLRGRERQRLQPGPEAADEDDGPHPVVVGGAVVGAAVVATGAVVAPGTVVAPGAEVKVYLVAERGERAKRRTADRPGIGADALATDLRARDASDFARMQPAEDAQQIDTTDLRVEDVVERIEQMVRARTAV